MIFFQRKVCRVYPDVSMEEGSQVLGTPPNGETKGDSDQVLGGADKVNRRFFEYNTYSCSHS